MAISSLQKLGCLEGHNKLLLMKKVLEEAWLAWVAQEGGHPPLQAYPHMACCQPLQ